MVEATPVLVNGEDIGLTASLGLALYESMQGVISPQALVERADKCLYQAKQGGRNQVAHEVIDMKTDLAVSTEEKEALSGMFGNYDDDDWED